MDYAIEITGYGKRRRYCIKKVINKAVYPFNCVGYGTEEEARQAAAEKGIEIAKCGDLWEII